MTLVDYFKLMKKDTSFLSTAPREEILNEYIKLYTLCQHYETALDNSKDAFGVTDEHGNMVIINKAYEHLCGESRNNLLFKNVKEIEGMLIDKSVTLMVLKSGRQMTAEQLHYKTQKHIHVTITPVFNEDGSLLMTVCNERDLEEIVALKERLADTEDMVIKYRQQIEAIQSELVRSGQIVARDKAMLDVLYRADKIAKVDATVLILGETGSGKEELVKYIHQTSDRRQASLIKINCGALTSSLIESELFGYEKGAFTGANASGKYGFFEAADNGIIFLDEIGELPIDLQVKLLRVLQEGEFYRIGGTRSIKTNARIISATNRDLKEMVKAGRFRSDLYYRLNVTSISLPSLRERANDIIPLATKFLNEFNRKYKMNKTISAAAYHALRTYDWPGNVRELRNVIEQALIISEGDTIRFDELPFILAGERAAALLGDDIDLCAMLEKMEISYLHAAYEKYGNVRDAARSLGMHASTFSRRRNKLKQC